MNTTCIIYIKSKSISFFINRQSNNTNHKSLGIMIYKDFVKPLQKKIELYRLNGITKISDTILNYLFINYTNIESIVTTDVNSNLILTSIN